jgi:regulator of sigma E protease
LHEAFNRKPVLQRMAVVVAGPVANLMLCVALLWGMFVIGRPDYRPVVGRADGLAQAAGLQAGDVILSVDGRETPTWTEAELAIVPAALDRRDVALRVATSAGREQERSLRLSRLPAEIDELRAVEATGLQPRHRIQPAQVIETAPGLPAAGTILPGDVITAIDGQPVRSSQDVDPLVQDLGRRGGSAMVEVDRAGVRLALEMSPRRADGDGEARWLLGVTLGQAGPPQSDALLRHGPVAAVPAALRETAHQTRELLAMLGRAVTGRVDVRNTVAGPITIARAANYYATRGPAWYLSILAMLSLSLGILNLLPIPILDGGHLLYYLIELVKGRPLSERAMAAGQFVGLALIAGLMGLAFYNDIVNNLLR